MASVGRKAREVWIGMRIGDYLALAACSVAAAAYAFAQGAEWLGLFANFGLIAYMGVASLVGVGAYLKLGGSRMAQVSLGFALGLLSWLLGLAIYTYAYFVAGTGLPYLSVADLFYLLSYLPWFASAVDLIRLFRRGIRKIGLLAVGVTGIIFYLLIIVYVIPASVTGLDNFLETFVTALYPSLDVAFLLLIIALFIAFRGGVFEKAFAFMALGMALLALGDLAYAVLSVTGLYYDGNPVDLLLFFGSVGAAYGFWRQYADLTKLK